MQTEDESSWPTVAAEQELGDMDCEEDQLLEPEPEPEPAPGAGKVSACSRRPSTSPTKWLQLKDTTKRARTGSQPHPHPSQIPLLHILQANAIAALSHLRWPWSVSLQIAGSFNTIKCASAAIAAFHQAANLCTPTKSPLWAPSGRQPRECCIQVSTRKNP